jgi:hypothetical protein
MYADVMVAVHVTSAGLQVDASSNCDGAMAKEARQDNRYTVFSSVRIGKLAPWMSSTALHAGYIVRRRELVLPVQAASVAPRTRSDWNSVGPYEELPPIDSILTC